MSISYPVNPVPEPPEVPVDDKETSWDDYHDNWQKYPHECCAYWMQYNLRGKVIDYWISLLDAQKAYKLAINNEEMPPWNCLADADSSYQKAFREVDEAKKKGLPKEPGIDEWLGYFSAWLDYRHAWCIHWADQKQPWRTEPEIDDKRRKELDKHRATRPNIETGDYPFKGMELTRADVEWLLASHENGRGWVDWDDKSQRERKGLDLRGAILRNVDLSGLPLARMLGGLSESERGNDKNEKWRRCREAAVRLEDSTLSEAHLEGAQLQFAHLEGADLDTAHLEGARLYRAHLERANLRYAYLDITTNLDSIFLSKFGPKEPLYKRIIQRVRGTSQAYPNKTYECASIADVRWGDVNLALVAWERVEKLGDELKAEEREKNVHEKFKTYRRAIRANQQSATIQRNQGLNKKADEFDDRVELLQKEMNREKNNWIRDHRRAIRANRQVATILQNQGLNEKADEFNYHAQVLQRKLLYRQGLWRNRGILAPKPARLQSIGMFVSSRVSWLLDFVAGYGYRPWRWLIIYLLALLGFTVAHHIAGGNITWLNAFSMSILNLHGRPFLPSSQDVQGVQGSINTVEAFVGLLIEAVLIAIIVKSIMGRSGA